MISLSLLSFPQSLLLACLTCCFPLPQIRILYYTYLFLCLSADVAVYHAAVKPGVRDQNLNRFLSAPRGESDRQILVCTDRASRGVDSAFVEHVVLFDFPRDPSEYIRRVGRTARGAGGKGMVTSLVLGRQVPLAKELVQRNQKGLPVHKIPDLDLM